MKNILFIFLALFYSLFFAGPACAKDLNIVVIQSRSLEPYTFVLNETIRLLKEKDIDCKGPVYILDDPENTPGEILKRITEKNPAIILAIGSEATVFSAENLKELSCVFTMVYQTDVMDEKLAVHEHVKGVFLNLEMKEPLALIKKLRPELQTIGVIYSPGLFSRLVDNLEKEAASAGLSVRRSEIKSETDLPGAIKKVTEEADAVYLLPDPMTMTAKFIKKIMLMSFQKKKFVFGESFEWVKKGALAGFAFDIREVALLTCEQLYSFSQTSTLSDASNVKCRNFKFFLNKRVADSLEVDIDKKLLRRAEKKGKIVR